MIIRDIYEKQKGIESLLTVWKGTDAVHQYDSAEYVEWLEERKTPEHIAWELERQEVARLQQYAGNRWAMEDTETLMDKCWKKAVEEENNV